MSSATEPAGFSVHRADWSRDREALRSVRQRVFVEEQSVPVELEWDGEDEGAIHLLAVDGHGQAIGTARLLPSGQIGRMAVLAEWRRRRVGSALLQAALAIAREPGRPTPFLNAQTAVLDFYHHHGFVPEGGEFMEAGIPHRHMVLVR
jgi:predicted GNAT family N-acyltransferase